MVWDRNHFAMQVKGRFEMLAHPQPFCNDMKKKVMEIRILAFGIAKDIFEGNQKTVVLPEGATVAELKQLLTRDFPALAALRSWMIAVNGAYAEDEQRIKQDDEVALIPPVSGG